jgi:predicted O-methyltransferase YrrM
MTKPFSQACENNKKAILIILKKFFSSETRLLEIGSGTGQHAVFMAANLPQTTWQTSDLLENHYGINQWLDEFPSNNLCRPILLDINSDWNLPQFLKPLNGIFTANTLHIISWPLVVKFFQGVTENLHKEGILCIYGPFNYQGKYTSESNENFDFWLKERNSDSAIRDFEAILSLATSSGLILTADHDMPANNRLLVFLKT